MNYALTFVDTWGWLALGHQREAQHNQVKQIYQSLLNQRLPIYTSDYVLDELITLLFRREYFAQSVRFVSGILADVNAKRVTVVSVTPERFGAAWQLRKKLQDKPGISFTDLVSMVIMQELGLARVLTTDEHFVQVGMGFSRVP